MLGHDDEVAVIPGSKFHDGSHSSTSDPNEAQQGFQPVLSLNYCSEDRRGIATPRFTSDHQGDPSLSHRGILPLDEQNNVLCGIRTRITPPHPHRVLFGLITDQSLSENLLVELEGLEPSTFSLQRSCARHCATTPRWTNCLYVRESNSACAVAICCHATESLLVFEDSCCCGIEPLTRQGNSRIELDTCHYVQASRGGRRVGRTPPLKTNSDTIQISMCTTDTCPSVKLWQGQRDLNPRRWFWRPEFCR